MSAAVRPKAGGDLREYHSLLREATRGLSVTERDRFLNKLADVLLQEAVSVQEAIDRAKEDG